MSLRILDGLGNKWPTLINTCKEINCLTEPWDISKLDSHCRISESVDGHIYRMLGAGWLLQERHCDLINLPCLNAGSVKFPEVWYLNWKAKAEHRAMLLPYRGYPRHHQQWASSARARWSSRRQVDQWWCGERSPFFLLHCLLLAALCRGKKNGVSWKRKMHPLSHRL